MHDARVSALVCMPFFNWQIRYSQNCIYRQQCSVHKPTHIQNKQIHIHNNKLTVNAKLGWVTNCDCLSFIHFTQPLRLRCSMWFRISAFGFFLLSLALSDQSYLFTHRNTFPILHSTISLKVKCVRCRWKAHTIAFRQTMRREMVGS